MEQIAGYLACSNKPQFHHEARYKIVHKTTKVLETKELMKFRGIRTNDAHL